MYFHSTSFGAPWPRQKSVSPPPHPLRPKRKTHEHTHTSQAEHGFHRNPPKVPLREIDGLASRLASAPDKIDEIIDAFFLGAGVAIVDVLSHFGAATNIPLEQELKGIKCSVAQPGAGQRFSTAERLRAASVLASMMQRHVAAGGVDNRKESTAQLLKEGVPLVSGRTTKVTDKIGGVRWNLEYANHSMSEWSRQHPRVSTTDRNTQRQVFFKDWASKLNDFERDQFQQRYNESLRVQEQIEIKSVSAQTLSLWQKQLMGTQSRWPISPDLVDPVLEQADKEDWDDDDVPHLKQGIVRRGKALRGEWTRNIYYSNKGAVPDDKVFEVKLACWQACPIHI